MCWRRIPHSLVGPDAGCTSKRSRAESDSTYTGPRRIQRPAEVVVPAHRPDGEGERILGRNRHGARSEEHTSELQSRFDLVCRLLLENKKNVAKAYLE